VKSNGWAVLGGAFAVTASLSVVSSLYFLNRSQAATKSNNEADERAGILQVKNDVLFLRLALADYRRLTQDFSGSDFINYLESYNFMQTGLRGKDEDYTSAKPTAVKGKLGQELCQKIRADPGTGGLIMSTSANISSQAGVRGIILEIKIDRFGEIVINDNIISSIH